MFRDRSLKSTFVGHGFEHWKENVSFHIFHEHWREHVPFHVNPISPAHFVSVLNFFVLQFSMSSSIHSNSMYNLASHGSNLIEYHSNWKRANSSVVLLTPFDYSFPVPFLSLVDPQFYVTVTISSLLILTAVIISAKLWWDVSTLCLHSSVIHPLRQLAALCVCVWVRDCEWKVSVS